MTCSGLVLEESSLTVTSSFSFVGALSTLADRSLFPQADHDSKAWGTAARGGAGSFEPDEEITTASCSWSSSLTRFAVD